MIAEIAAGIRYGINFLQPHVEKVPEVVKFGSIETKAIGLKPSDRLFLPNPDVNLAAAEQLRIKPLTFADILVQIPLDELPHTVFTDKVPDFANLAANYWRLEQLDLESKKAYLQHGNPLGNQDDRCVFPIKLPFSHPFFTGARIQHNMRGEERVDLKTIAALFPSKENIEYFGQTPYLSNESGILVPFSQHPLYSIGMLTAK